MVVPRLRNEVGVGGIDDPTLLWSSRLVELMLMSLRSGLSVEDNRFLIEDYGLMRINMLYRRHLDVCVGVVIERYQS